MNAQESPVLQPDQEQSAKLKVFGIGGGGCNALEQIIAADIKGVEFKCVNTDAQALAKYKPENTIALGNELTRGLGAGADPDVGRRAAEESSEEIAEAIGDADMLFLTSGMGGGTGTGAVPVVARIARELGVLTVAVVTEPFAFEGDRRRRMAEAGLAELRDNADSMIVVPNENLLTYLGPDVSLIEAFAAANDVVTNAVQSIAELITTTGLINVDFADVKSVMTEMGYAIMSTGKGMGENRARDAATEAIESPLLNNIDLEEARGILANITVSTDISMGEFQIVGDIIRGIAAEDATVVIGTVIDDQANYEMQVTVVATGLNPPDREAEKVKREKAALKLVEDKKAKEAAEAAALEAEKEAEIEAEKKAAEEALVKAQVSSVQDPSSGKLSANDDGLTKANGISQGSVGAVPHADNAYGSDLADAVPSRSPAASKSTAAESKDLDQVAQTSGLDAATVRAQAAKTASHDSAGTSSPSGSVASIVDSCMICGGKDNNHKDNCPNFKKSEEVKYSFQSEAATVKSAASGKKIGNTQLMIFAGAVLTLIGIFYVVLTGKFPASTDANKNAAVNSAATQPAAEPEIQAASEFQFVPVANPIRPGPPLNPEQVKAESDDSSAP